MERVRWGIVGCGNAAKLHALALREIESVDLVGCVSRNVTTAQAFAEEFNIKAFKSLDDLLKEVDVISVCTPSGTHKDIVVQAARKKVHVIVEKPLDVTLEAIDEIITAARENGVVVGCVLQSRFSRATAEMKALLDQGKFGRIVLGEADVRWYRSEEYYTKSGWRGTWRYDGGGALINQAIHTIDLLQYLLGPVKRVYGVTKTLLHHIEVEDTAVAVLEFASGTLGVVKGATSISPGFPRRLGVYGTKGSGEIVGETLVIYDENHRNGKIVVTEEGDPSSDPMAFPHKNHKKQLEDFVQAVKSGRRPAVDAVEGKKAVEIVLAIYKASTEGRVIDLPLQEVGHG